MSKDENVHRSRAAVNTVVTGKRLHVYWVPGHKGVSGNKIADDITKSAIRWLTAPLQKIRKSLK